MKSNRFGPFQPELCIKSSSDSLKGYWICKGPPGKSQLEVESDIVLLWFHGGGYCFGDPLSPAVSLLRVAEIAGARGISMSIFSVEYTLAPAATFPRQQEEAVAAYRHLVETQAIPPDKIILAGDSAGGHLVLSCLIALHREGIQRPKGALLMYPWVNLTNNSPTFESNRHKDVLSKRLLDRCVEAVIGERGRVEALNLEDLINPWEPGREHAWDTILPPFTWVNVGEHDVLLHDVQTFVVRARAKGARVHLEVRPNATHGWNFAVDKNAEKFFCGLGPDDQVPKGVMAGSDKVCEGIFKIIEDDLFAVVGDED